MSDEKTNELTKKIAGNVGNSNSTINFPTGTIEQGTLDKILSLMPFEMGFCDENDIFRWYTNNPGRVHKRHLAALGKNVTAELHPSTREHVKKLLDDFRAGRKDEWEFWFPKRDGQLGQIYQKFMAVRDSEGKYVGCFDVTINLDLFKGKTEGKHTPEEIADFQQGE